MAEAKHTYWLDAQFAVYFLATRLGEQPGAVEALAQANELVAQFLNEGYEPLSVLSLGPTKLTLANAGELDGTRIVVLWALQGHRSPEDQRVFLELSQERQESRREAMVLAERHKASEDAKREVADKVEAAKKDASILQHIASQLDRSN